MANYGACRRSPPQFDASRADLARAELIVGAAPMTTLPDVSLIRLRAKMRRRRHQAAWFAALVSVCGLLAVHHLEPPAAHAPSAPVSHGGHLGAAPEPSSALDLSALAICLAILPMAALLALGLARPTARRVRARGPLLASPSSFGVCARAPETRSRAGPHVLCVVRC